MKALLAKLLGLNWLGLGGFLLKNWQACIALTFVGCFLVALHQRDMANVEKGKAIEAATHARADSTRLAKESKAQGDSIAQLLVNMEDQREGYAQDIARLGLSLGRVDTLTLERWVHDTVEKLPPSTLIPIPAGAVVTTDSVLRACSVLVSDCEAFKAMALRRFATDSQRIAAAYASRVDPPKEHRCGIQLTAGFGAVGTSKSNVHAGPGAIVGVGCHY